MTSVIGTLWYLIYEYKGKSLRVYNLHICPLSRTLRIDHMGKWRKSRNGSGSRGCRNGVRTCGDESNGEEFRRIIDKR